MIVALTTTAVPAVGDVGLSATFVITGAACTPAPLLAAGVGGFRNAHVLPPSTVRPYETSAVCAPNVSSSMGVSDSS